MKLTQTVCAAVVLLAGSALCSAQSTSGMACSNATLHGNYSFTIVGQILAPAAAAGLVSGVALSHFDGQGNMSQIDHVLHNGIAPSVEWRTANNSSYSVNQDCTGTMTVVFDDGSPTLHLEIVIANNGNEIRTVVTQPFLGSAVQPVITSIGTKVFSPALSAPVIQ